MKITKMIRNGQSIGLATSNQEIADILGVTRQYFHKTVKGKDNITIKGDDFVMIDITQEVIKTFTND